MVQEAAPPAADDGLDEAPPNRGSGLLRSTLHITAGNLASRVTGFVRAVVVAAVLGATYLGNTYQTANLVSNFLFDLLAAGLLSSVLVPPFVRLLDAGRREDAERLAGAILGVALAALGAVTVLALLLRPVIMRALTTAVDDPSVRSQEVELGSFLLLFFLPQVLLYAVGAVCTAVLHGGRRFAAPAFAPLCNNVIVIGTMALYWLMESSGDGLNLSRGPKLVLAVGTTAGVAAMALLPLMAAWRSGVRVRPRWAPREPELRRLARSGLWAAAYLALAEVLIVTTVILANRIPGGVVAYQLAFTIFLLPFALLAQPTATASYPRLAAEWLAHRTKGFAAAFSTAAGTIVFLVIPASALMWALADPAVALIPFGSFGRGGTELAVGLVEGYAFGLLGYCGLQLLTFAFYSANDTRTPTLVHVGITAGGSALMVALFTAASGDDRITMIGVAYSVAVVAGAAALLLLLRRRTGSHAAVGGSLARALTCGVAAAVVGRVIASALYGDGRVEALTATALGAAGALVVYLGGQWCLRAPELRRRLGRRPAGEVSPAAQAAVQSGRPVS